MLVFEDNFERRIMKIGLLLRNWDIGSIIYWFFGWDNLWDIE